MTWMRSALLTLLLALALAAVGCGGGENVSAPAGQTQEPARLAPGDAAGYIGVDTNLDSAQWQQLEELLERFPDGDRVVEWIVKELGEEDVSWEDDIQPALGPVTAFVLLAKERQPVVLVQPSDRSKLDALLAKSDEQEVTADLEDGWVAVANKQAHLDAFRAGADRGRLDDSSSFKEAMAGLPADSLASVYVGGDALKGDWSAYAPLGSGVTGIPAAGAQLQSLGLAVEADDDGLRLVGSVRSDGGPQPQSYEPELFARVPDSAIIALSFHGTPELTQQLGSQGGLGPFLPAVEEVLGMKVEELVELLEGEAALYVRPGLVIPEVSLAVEAPDPARAMGVVDRIARGLGQQVETLEIDGVTAHAVTVENVRVVWAAFDGVLLVSTGQSAIRDFRSGGSKLVDDARFDEAMARVGLGERTGGFVFVDLDEAVPFIEGLAGLSGERLPDVWRRNLEPLETFAAEGAAEGDAIRFDAFLAVGDS
jgi:Protein of unknown function (DUF3352)